MKFADALVSTIRAAIRDVVGKLQHYYISQITSKPHAGNVHGLSNGTTAIVLNGGSYDVGASVVVLLATDGKQYIPYFGFGVPVDALEAAALTAVTGLLSYSRTSQVVSANLYYGITPYNTILRLTFSDFTPPASGFSGAYKDGAATSIPADFPPTARIPYGDHASTLVQEITPTTSLMHIAANGDKALTINSGYYMTYNVSGSTCFTHRVAMDCDLSAVVSESGASHFNFCSGTTSGTIANLAASLQNVDVYYPLTTRMSSLPVAMSLYAADATVTGNSLSISGSGFGALPNGADVRGKKTVAAYSRYPIVFQETRPGAMFVQENSGSTSCKVIERRIGYPLSASAFGSRAIYYYGTPDHPFISCTAASASGGTPMGSAVSYVFSNLNFGNRHFETVGYGEISGTAYAVGTWRVLTGGTTISGVLYYGNYVSGLLFSHNPAATPAASFSVFPLYRPDGTTGLAYVPYTEVNTSYPTDRNFIVHDGYLISPSYVRTLANPNALYSSGLMIGLSSATELSGTTSAPQYSIYAGSGGDITGGSGASVGISGFTFPDYHWPAYEYPSSTQLFGGGSGAAISITKYNTHQSDFLVYGDYHAYKLFEDNHYNSTNVVRSSVALIELRSTASDLFSATQRHGDVCHTFPSSSKYYFSYDDFLKYFGVTQARIEDGVTSDAGGLDVLGVRVSSALKAIKFSGIGQTTQLTQKLYHSSLFTAPVTTYDAVPISKSYVGFTTRIEDADATIATAVIRIRAASLPDVSGVDIALSSFPSATVTRSLHPTYNVAEHGIIFSNDHLRNYLSRTFGSATGLATYSGCYSGTFNMYLYASNTIYPLTFLPGGYPAFKHSLNSPEYLISSVDPAPNLSVFKLNASRYLPGPLADLVGISGSGVSGSASGVGFNSQFASLTCASAADYAPLVSALAWYDPTGYDYAACTDGGLAALSGAEFSVPMASNTKLLAHWGRSVGTPLGCATPVMQPATVQFPVYKYYGFISDIFANRVNFTSNTYGYGGKPADCPDYTLYGVVPPIVSGTNNTGGDTIYSPIIYSAYPTIYPYPSHGDYANANSAPANCALNTFATGVTITAATPANLLRSVGTTGLLPAVISSKYYGGYLGVVASGVQLSCIPSGSAILAPFGGSAITLPGNSGSFALDYNAGSSPLTPGLNLAGSWRSSRDASVFIDYVIACLRYKITIDAGSGTEYFDVFHGVNTPYPLGSATSSTDAAGSATRSIYTNGSDITFSVSASGWGDLWTWDFNHPIPEVSGTWTQVAGACIDRIEPGSDFIFQI